MSNRPLRRKSNSSISRKSSIISVLDEAEVFQLLNEGAAEYVEAKRRRDEAERTFSLHVEKISDLIRRMREAFGLELDQ